MSNLKNVIIFVVTTLFYTLQNSSYSEYIPVNTACDSTIFCRGDFLHYAQTLKIFNDSKTFVDMKAKCPIKNITDFVNTTEWKDATTDRDVRMLGFINKCFDKEGSEFEPWIPTDFKQNPTFLNSIKDISLKNWSIAINNKWTELGRTIIDDVRTSPTNYSLIYVPNPIIIPGGRFREIYYWDSYWIVRGLLICEMNLTAKGLIENYISMIKTYGHVPNGGRVYYIKRSQPPMTIPMVKSYVEATNDIAFVKNNIEYLEIEFNYWMTEHNVTINRDGKNYTLAVYKVNSKGPRPESYREDIDLAKEFTTESEKEDFYSEIKAAAESGWDFSSRWFISNRTNEGTIVDTKTRSIVPVDLNSILYWNAKILSDFYRIIIKNTTKSLEYETISLKWKEAVTEILWDEEMGSWFDYDLINNIQRRYFYPTNLSPLWTGCFDEKKTEYIVTRILKNINKTEIMETEGGMPTTLQWGTDQQWDQPNAWAPLQYIAVMALHSTGHKDAQTMASKIASKWLCTNYVPYYNFTKMYEKYRVDKPGRQGVSSGEYEIQDGFGWSNGIVLEFLQLYNYTTSIEDWKTTAKDCYDVMKQVERLKKRNDTNKIDNN